MPETEVSQTHATLTEALLAFHAEAPDLHKDKNNPAFKGSRYLSLDGLTDAVRPLLNKHGLVWATMPSSLDGGPALTYELHHVSGTSIRSTMPLILEKKNAQGQGSAITYARRYALMAVLNLVADDDDDGNAASEPTPAPHKDDARPAAPRIPRDRAAEILASAVRIGCATYDMEGSPGDPPVYNPTFKALLAMQDVSKIGDLNADTAEAVEAWLRNEEAQGATA